MFIVKEILGTTARVKAALDCTCTIMFYMMAVQLFSLTSSEKHMRQI